MPRVRTGVTLFILMMVFLLTCGGWFELRRVEVRTQRFEESSRLLENPNRGFYRLYGFLITDEEKNYASQLDEYYSWAENPVTLTMVEINLLEYRAGEITPAGLDNLDALFRTLSEDGRQLIVRFLYDWERKNLQTEPASLDIILRHMEQVGEILQRYEGSIFTLQGLFVGDWGEMHNTRYDSPADLRRLAEQLSSVTQARLAVRTPAQWRQITQNGKDVRLVERMGLFNDGMLGSETDLGTYDMAYQGEQRRTREEELAFQEALCRDVPNGGEAVTENPCNDFENAVRDLERMRVTYLNRDYDAAVLEKWAAARVSSRGCFNGLDGLSYIERRLGYRLFIHKADLRRSALRHRVTVEVSMRNAGFAPLYEEPEVILTLCDRDGQPVGEYPAEHSLRELTGGRDTDKTSVIEAVIPVEGLPRGVYQVCLDLRDPASGERILLANTQDRGPYGYCLGEIEIFR